MDPVPPWSAYASYNRLAGVQPGTTSGDIHHHHLTTQGTGGVPTAATTPQLLPGGFLSPPPPVSYETVFPPLFHHAATAKPAPHYVTPHRQVLAQAAVSKQSEGEYHHQQAQAFFDQNSGAWQQNSPFGILPHETVSTTKSYENFNAHFAALSNNHLNSLAVKNASIRAQSPQVPVTFSPAPDVAAPNNKVYAPANNNQNIQQSCIVTSSNAAANAAPKEYRVPQAPIRTAFISSPNAVRVEKGFAPVGLKQVPPPQIQTKAQTKIYDIPNQVDRQRAVEEANHHQQQQQQQQQPNTPISFSIMDASRLNYVNTVANSVNKRPFQATYRHYQQPPNSEVEFQRAKEFSNGNGPDCNVVVPRRPSPLQAHSQTSPLGHAPSPVYPMYNSPMNTAIPSPQNTSNHVTPPSPLDVTVPRPNSQNNVAYPSVITRASNPNDNKMYPDRYERPAQNQNWKFNNNYPVANNIEVPNRQIESHQDLSSCRGDPMSIVKTLQQQQSCQMQPVEIKQEVKTIKRRRSSEKQPVPVNEIPGRIPPPAHCTTLNQQPQNGAYFDFERWNLPPPPTKIFNPQTMQQHQGLMVPHPHPHHVPSPIHYFAPFPLPPHPPEFQPSAELTPLTTYNEQQPPAQAPHFPSPDDQPKVVVPNIEEELNFLSEATPPSIPRPPQIQQSKAINPPNVAKPADKPAGAGFMSSYIKFLQGERDSSPPPAARTGRKQSWTKMKPTSEIKPETNGAHVSAPPPPPPTQLKRLSQGDPQDDPRYFPLPKDRKNRFDSSDDGISSEDDLFNRKMPPVNKDHTKAVRKGRPCKPGGPTEKRRAKQAAKLKREKERVMKAATAPQPSQLLVPATEIVVTRRESSKRAAKQKAMLVRDEEVDEAQDFADSDSDPAWMPAAKEDGEDDVPLRKSRRAKPTTKRKGTRNLISAAVQGAGIQEHDGHNNVVKKPETPVTPQILNNVAQAVTNNVTTPADIQTVDISNNSNGQEYPFKPGEFVVIKSELGQPTPSIWRVDGKTLLQKYEPFQQHGQTFYRNISTYTSWTPENKKQYIAVPVNIRSQTHAETIVEFKSDLVVKDVAIIDRSVHANVKYQDNFEVYIQTLISQALDSNFLMEIFLEQDEYFLSNVKIIDSVAANKKAELATALRWPIGIQTSISTWPCFNVIGDFAHGDTRRWNCAACGLQAVASRVLLYGQPYNNSTLEGCPVKTDSIHEKDFIMCRPCANSVQLFNKITHQKYLMYIECAKRVAEKRTMDAQKDTTCILNELLADEKWLQQLFLEVRKSWAEVDSVVHKHSEHKPVL